MSHTIQLTAEQFEALQSGQPITIEPPKPFIQRWEPKGRDFNILDNTVLANTMLAGFRYNNTTQAEQASKAIRSYARQLAWLAENDDGWVADWSKEGQSKYFIYIAHKSNKVSIYRSFTVQSFGLVYMSEPNAIKLAQLMNDGIVEF